MDGKPRDIIYTFTYKVQQSHFIIISPSIPYQQENLKHLSTTESITSTRIGRPNVLHYICQQLKYFQLEYFQLEYFQLIADIFQLKDIQLKYFQLDIRIYLDTNLNLKYVQ